MSSTESELIALSDGLNYLIGLKNFIKELDIKVNNTNIYQDNQSTIQLINNEFPKTQRTKHINIKYFGIKEKINKNKFTLKYKRTSEMIADIVTKPIQGKLFRLLCEKLFNSKVVSEKNDFNDEKFKGKR